MSALDVLNELRQQKQETPESILSGIRASKADARGPLPRGTAYRQSRLGTPRRDPMDDPLRGLTEEEKSLARERGRTGQTRTGTPTFGNLEQAASQIRVDKALAAGRVPSARDLPEIGQAPQMNEFTRGAFLASLGATFTFDDQEVGNILQQQLSATPTEDEEGNIVVQMPDGQYFAVNKPGLSGQDIVRGVATGAAFTPAGRAGGITAQAGAAAGTQAAIEAGQAGIGGEFDPEDIAIAGAGVPIAAAAGAALQPAASRFVQLAKGNRQLVGSDGLPTKAFESALKRRGLDYGQIIDDVEGVNLTGSPRRVVDEIIKRQIRQGRTGNALARVRVSGGRVVEDPLGIQAIDQGWAADSVSLAKAANRSTKNAMRRALNMQRRINADPNRVLDFRPTDVAGDEVVRRVHYVRGQANDLRRELNRVAAKDLGRPLIGPGDPRLSQLQVDPDPVARAFIDQLDALNVPEERITQYINSVRAGQPVNIDFSRTLIARDRTSQRVIQDVADMLSEVDNTTGLTAHDLKRALDSMIDYRRQSSEGLSDAGKRVARGVRRALNQSIRRVSPRYADINDQLSDAIESLGDIQQAVGRTIDVFDEGAEQAVGTKLKTLLSNQQGRVNLNNALNQLDDTAQALGGRFDVDYKRLMRFTNTLDDRFKTSAETSFKGQQEAAIAGAERLRQAPVTTTLQKAEEAIRKRRQNDTKAFNAMTRILNR